MRSRRKAHYWTFFGVLFDELSDSPEWGALTLEEKALRLERAFRDHCNTYGCPGGKEGASLFEDAITCLELPD